MKAQQGHTRSTSAVHEVTVLAMAANELLWVTSLPPSASTSLQQQSTARVQMLTKRCASDYCA
jgi:hypothetical protein